MLSKSQKKCFLNTRMWRSILFTSHRFHDFCRKECRCSDTDDGINKKTKDRKATFRLLML